MAKKEKEEIPVKFWNDWLDSDEEKRIKLVQATMVARESAEYLLLRLKKSKVDKKFIKYTTARHINDYFQDLEQAMLSRKRQKRL